MSELLDKIGSYNLFNYLLPGVVFIVLLNEIFQVNFIQDDIFVAAFFYYFVGLVLSRLGSVLLEPVLKKFGFIRFEEYSKYLDAIKEDSKLEVFVEASNTYRTFAAVFLVLTIINLFGLVKNKFPISSDTNVWVGLFLMLLLFLLSYRKQTLFISSRIRKIANGKSM